MAEYNPDHAAEDLLAIYSFTGGVAKYVQLLIDAGATTKTKMINHMRNMMIALFSPIPTGKLPIEQIYQGGESKARNQRMQNMFRMIGYGENLGSGFPLILNAWNEKHWMKPELVEQPELMQVKLTLYLENETNQDGVKELSDIQESIKRGITNFYQFSRVTDVQEGKKLSYNNFGAQTGVNLLFRHLFYS